MKSAAKEIEIKLAEALASDPPGIIARAIAGIAEITANSDLAVVATYITESLHAFGMLDSDIARWDAPHLALIGYHQSELDRHERELEVSFYRGYTLRIERTDKPHFQLNGPALSPALALSDLERIHRIIIYLQSLSYDFIHLSSLATDAVASAREFASSLKLSEGVRFEDSIDSYMSDHYGEALKSFILRIPKTLKALSRNYYYVPDHWIECDLTIPYEVDSDTRCVNCSKMTDQNWTDLRAEIEKEIWRIRNQPGYLTTEAKLRFLKHEQPEDTRPIDAAVGDRRQLSVESDRGQLNETQLVALTAIEQDGPILGKNLAKRLGIEESTLRKHVIPYLKPFGVTSTGDGYRVAPRCAT